MGLPVLGREAPPRPHFRRDDTRELRGATDDG